MTIKKKKWQFFNLRNITGNTGKEWLEGDQSRIGYSLGCCNEDKKENELGLSPNGGTERQF